MNRRPRTLFIGLAAACVTVTPFTAVDADERVPAVTGDDAPTWLETILPDPGERALLASDDAFEFVAGGVLVSEPGLLGPPPPAEAAIDAPTPPTSEGPVTEIEAFSLHSNPGADQVIFLDFDGHTIEGTAWNVGRAARIVVGSYSREPRGEENETFSQSELDAIVEIWERVAEDFAPWPVDVTTEDPGDDALYSTNRTLDSEYGARVVITHDSAWYGNSGGVAYVGTFGDRFYSPAFAFSNNLGRGSPKSVAEAASHEVGHNLGLSHDGVNDTDPDPEVDNSVSYYAGHGNWAPIMGVGYFKPITQWSKGEYADASQTQDDIDRIDFHIPGRPIAAAPTGALGGTDSTTVAVLSDGGGEDIYDLDIDEGPASVTLEKVDPDGNLLADLVIIDDATGEITTLEPTDDRVWSHTIDDIVPGSYTVVVRSVGWANPVTDGFSDYASIGEYVLTVDVPESTGTTSTTTSTTSSTLPEVTTTVPDVTTTIAPPTTVTPTTPPPVTTAPPTTQPEVTTTTTSATTTTTTIPAPPTPPTPEPTGHRLDSFAPIRLLDTRVPSSLSSRLEAGENIRVPIAGVDGIADDARAAVINVVAVKPASNGFLSVTPCTAVDDDERTSSLNFTTGGNIANSTISTLTDDGDVCIYASTATDVVVDVTGAIGPSGTTGLIDTTTRRLADSRTGDAIDGRLLAGDTAFVSLAGVVDGTTSAVAVNVTAVKPSSNGFLTIDNCDALADTAALNFSAGENRGNNGIFALSVDQALCVTTSADVDVIIDITGAFGGGGFTYVPANPVRLLDTRTTRPITGGSSTSFDVPAPQGANLTASTPAAAASVNLASARHPRNGYVTAWDCGAMPESSAFNPVVGQVTANGALVPLNGAGRSCLFHEAGGELIVDLNGWWV